MTQLKSDTERIQPAAGTGMERSSWATPQHSLTNLASFIKGKDKERKGPMEEMTGILVCVCVFLKFRDLSTGEPAKAQHLWSPCHLRLNHPPEYAYPSHRLGFPTWTPCCVTHG